MKEPKFTKGEWEVSGLTVRVDHRGIVAEIPTPRRNGVFECTDNLTLIAAAPDLYFACQALCNAVAQLEGSPVEYGAAIELSNALKVGRAALQKADGETE